MNFLELTAVLGLNKKDYDKGLDDASSKASSFASGLGNVVKVVGGAVVAGVGAAATGITALTTQAVNAYGNYEQLVGGVNKIFGESAQAVMDNASKAFSTAGMSANQYMETVTSFSASLIQSLGGDTAKAVSYADTAIRDMSDNANTFGTDISSIQAAYQGFAKQNYTMLDNLKLGYGGTQSEVERLIRDAEKLDNTFSVTHTKTKKGADEISYSYADIVQAIHIVQGEMNITGTTAKEAGETIQGTAGSLKGAWENLITGLGDANADLGPLIDNVIQSAIKMVNNIKPIATQAVQGIAKLVTEVAPIIAEELPPMLESILPALVNAIASLVNAVAKVFPSLIKTLLPPLISAATTVFKSLVVALPTLLKVLADQLPTILQELIPAVLEVLPSLIEATITILVTIGRAFADNIDLLMDAVMAIIHFLVDELLTPDNLKEFVLVALDIILALAEGIIKNIPEIIGAIVILIGNIIVALGEALPDIGLAVIEFIVKLADDFGQQAYDAFGSSFYDLLVGVGEWFGTIGEVISLGCERIVTFFINLGTKIKNIVSTIWNSVTSFFVNGFNKIKDTVSKSLEAVKKTFTDIFEKVKTTVKNAIEFLKGLFNFNWSLPKIKLPHFKVSGGEAPWGFGGQGSLPSVKVDWYKKAMNTPYFLDSATIFGAAGGKLLGGGEAGSEVIVGTDKLMEMMKQAVGAGREIVINIYGAEGQDVRELAKLVGEELQNLVDDKESVYA